uniref:GH13342p n=1 Tax=Drosophila melanogaster TaxID=7227 RepID=Q8MRN2_DROME|nr:GH13342p [Drosophila melanogaster]
MSSKLAIAVAIIWCPRRSAGSPRICDAPFRNAVPSWCARSPRATTSSLDSWLLSIIIEKHTS